MKVATIPRNVRAGYIPTRCFAMKQKGGEYEYRARESTPFELFASTKKSLVRAMNRMCPQTGWQAQECHSDQVEVLSVHCSIAAKRRGSQEKNREEHESHTLYWRK